MFKDTCSKDIDEDEHFETFYKVFYDELESWFSADIACCDDCLDEFLTKWPAVDTRNFDFQRNAITLGSFYSGSRLSSIFTQDEFNKFVKKIPCPNCGSPLCNNIWPYNFKFDLPDNFDRILEEMSSLAKKTPFLLLSHSFALDTLKAIKELSHKVESTDIRTDYYRARKLEKGKHYGNDDFKYPPRGKIGEGRYNHAGSLVIYLANNLNTCFYELRQPNDGIAIAKIKITGTLKVLDLIEIEDDESNIINAAAWSSLMSSPYEGDGWYKPQYIFTRFIADCAIHAGFDAIRYPSVRFGHSHNIVLLDGVTQWSKMDLIDIKEMEKGDFKLKPWE